MGLLAVPEDSKSMCQPAQRTAKLSDELSDNPHGLGRTLADPSKQ